MSIVKIKNMYWHQWSHKEPSVEWKGSMDVKGS